MYSYFHIFIFSSNLFIYSYLHIFIPSYLHMFKLFIFSYIYRHLDLWGFRILCIYIYIIWLSRLIYIYIYEYIHILHIYIYTPYIYIYIYLIIIWLYIYIMGKPTFSAQLYLLAHRPLEAGRNDDSTLMPCTRSVQGVAQIHQDMPSLERMFFETVCGYLLRYNDIIYHLWKFTEKCARKLI